MRASRASGCFAACVVAALGGAHAEDPVTQVELEPPGDAAIYPGAERIGTLTATVGDGQLTDAQGNPGEWRISAPIRLGDRLVTPAGAYAMIFFVSGLGGEIEFEGTIVVDVDENSTVEIREGEGRRAPIDIHVTAGRVRAFFDAGEHKDYILLSTPLGQMRVTGSVIYAAHEYGGIPGTEFGSFDSQCQVLTADGAELVVSQGQKVRLEEGVEGVVSDLTAADLTAWDSMPDMNFAAAAAQRSLVRVDFAGRAWVGEYLTGGQRLENVAAEASANIPSQEPTVVAVTPATAGRVVAAPSRPSQPRLRSSSGRVFGDDEEDGFDREPTAAARGPLARQGPVLDPVRGTGSVRRAVIPGAGGPGFSRSPSR